VLDTESRLVVTRDDRGQHTVNLRLRINGGLQVLARIHSYGVSNTPLEGVDSLWSSVPDRSLDA
jgi:hypothetical protein